MPTKYLDNVDFNGQNLKIRDTEARALIQTNSDEIVSVKAKANLNEQKIDALTPRVDTLENTVDDLDERLTAAESDIDNLEVHMAAAEDDIDNLEDDVNALTNRMTSAEGNIDALTNRMNTAETNINNLTDTVNDHTEKIDDLTTDVKDLKPRMDAAEVKNTEQDKKLAELDEKIVASTYEAGIGIYFGQGVEHTNINVEDELLDEIHASTQKNIEQDARLDAIEDKNDEQDDRLDEIETNYVKDVVVNNSHNIDVKTSNGSVKNTITGEVTYTPAGTVSIPTFTGTEGNVTVFGTPIGVVSQPNFTGTQEMINVVGTPAGTITGASVTLSKKVIGSLLDPGTLGQYNYDSADEQLEIVLGTLPSYEEVTVALDVQNITQGTFTGTSMTSTGTYTPSGTVSQPTFTGSNSEASGVFTPAGEVSRPTFTGTQATEDVEFNEL